MKILMLAAALGLAAIATPAAAQTATEEQAMKEAVAPFVALKDALIENVGTSDTVIMLYGEWTIDPARKEAQFRFFVRYRVPGTNIVRIQGERLGANIPTILDASHELINADNDARAVVMIIDHGKVSVAVRHIDVFDESLDWKTRSDAEIALVYPGLFIEPYKAP